MFNAYDIDGDGEISFTDYMLTLSVSERGTMDEKLRWAFSMYDINGDGQVSLKEATEILTVSRLDIPHCVGDKTCYYNRSVKLTDPLRHCLLSNKVRKAYQMANAHVKPTDS